MGAVSGQERDAGTSGLTRALVCWEAGWGALPCPQLRFHICQLEWDVTLGRLNINHVSENRQTFLCDLKLEESVCGHAAS